VPPNKEQRKQLRWWLKLADNLDDKCGHFVKGIDRIDSSGTNIGEAYEGVRIPCHLHVSLETRGLNPDAQDLCVSFQRLQEIDIMSIDDLAPDISKDTSKNPGFVFTKQDWGYDPVLISIGRVSESREGVYRGNGGHIPGMPSVVRLAPLNSCSLPGSEFIERAVSLEVFRSRVGGRAVILDGKLNTLRITRLFAPGANKGKLPEEVIQGSPKIVDNVSDYDAPASLPVFWEGCRAEDVVTAFRVELNAKSYSVAFRPRSDVQLMLKDLTVLFGPPNLVPTTTEVGLVGHEVEESP
jgi:hypothetical protein